MKEHDVCYNYNSLPLFLLFLLKYHCSFKSGKNDEPGFREKSPRQAEEFPRARVKSSIFPFCLFNRREASDGITRRKAIPKSLSLSSSLQIQSEIDGPHLLAHVQIETHVGRCYWIERDAPPSVDLICDALPSETALIKKSLLDVHVRYISVTRVFGTIFFLKSQTFTKFIKGFNSFNKVDIS